MAYVLEDLAWIKWGKNQVTEKGVFSYAQSSVDVSSGRHCLHNRGHEKQRDKWSTKNKCL